LEKPSGASDGAANRRPLLLGRGSGSTGRQRWKGTDLTMRYVQRGGRVWAARFAARGVRYPAKRPLGRSEDGGFVLHVVITPSCAALRQVRITSRHLDPSSLPFSNRRDHHSPLTSTLERCVAHPCQSLGELVAFHGTLCRSPGRPRGTCWRRSKDRVMRSRLHTAASKCGQLKI